MKYATSLFIVLLSCFSPANSFQWQDERGSPLPQTSARKSVDGFGGLLLITPDRHWREKWATPADHIPVLEESDRVTKGNELQILVFFTNPQPDYNNFINIGCDIKITRPDGSIAVNANDLNCSEGESVHKPGYVLITDVGMTYVAEEDDLLGEWSVEVDIVDRVKNVRVSLSDEFTVLE